MLSPVQSTALADLIARIQAAAGRFPDTYLIAAKADVPTWPQTDHSNDPEYPTLGLGEVQKQSLLRAVIPQEWGTPPNRFIDSYWFTHKEEKFQALLFDYVGDYSNNGSAVHSAAIKEFRRLADEAAGYFPALAQLQPHFDFPLCNDPPGPWLAVMFDTLPIKGRRFRRNPDSGGYADADLSDVSSHPSFTVLQPPAGSVFSLLLCTLDGLNGTASFPPNASVAMPRERIAGGDKLTFTLRSDVRNWLTARYLTDPTPGQWQITDSPEPIVFVKYEDFADFLVGAGVDPLPNLNNWTDAGWIVDVKADLTANDNTTREVPNAIARLNLPSGRHRLVGIRKTVLTAPADPTPLPAVLTTPHAVKGEGEKPGAVPFVPLTSWSEIIAALNPQHGPAEFKNNEQTRAKILKLNEHHRGPIQPPQGKGTHPRVDKAALVEWWNGLKDHFDARSDEAALEAESAKSTVADSYKHGRAAIVVPGISGSEKKRRTAASRKGKEPNR